MRTRMKALLTGAGAAALAALAAIPLMAATAPHHDRPAAAPAKATAPRAHRKPNVIVILVDDLGHNDVSINGNPLVKTPNIDSIGYQGARAITGYSGDAVCATSRAALLTGRRPQRFGFEYLPEVAGFEHAGDGSYGEERYKNMEMAYTAPPPDKNGLPDSELTIAQFMKNQGYRTAIFGKWHEGVARNLWPDHRGFDEWVGIPGGAGMHADPNDPNYVSARLPHSGIDGWLWANMKRKIVRNWQVVDTGPGYTADIFADEAVKFIDRNKDRPFFLYLTPIEPHNPLQAPKRIYDQLTYIKDHKTRVYYAMIQALDEAIGRVLKEVDKQGLAEDTVIIFTSDNGGAHYTEIAEENLPYRGWKITYFEGGVNVPYLVRWKGHIKPGTIVPGMVSSLDIFPTAAALAGAKMPTDRPYDGVDLMPMLTNANAPNHLDERTLVWRKEDLHLMRDGKWKLQVSKYPQKTWLFDLEADPTERFNLADAMPAKVAELRAKMAKEEQGFIKPLWEPKGRARVDIDGFNETLSPNVEHTWWAN